MASNYLRRIERLECRKGRDSCVACALARFTYQEAKCDGESCRLTLADLLSGLEDAKCETI